MRYGERGRKPGFESIRLGACLILQLWLHGRPPGDVAHFVDAGCGHQGGRAAALLRTLLWEAVGARVKALVVDKSDVGGDAGAHEDTEFMVADFERLDSLLGAGERGVGARRGEMNLILACGSLYREPQLGGAVAAFHALAAPACIVLLVGWSPAEYILIIKAARQLEERRWKGIIAAFSEEFANSPNGLFGIVALVGPGASDDQAGELWVAAMRWLAALPGWNLDRQGFAGGGSAGGSADDDDEYSD